MYTVDATGAATHVVGSPFATGGVSTTLAWARDGEALYVSTSVAGPAPGSPWSDAWHCDRHRSDDGATWRNGYVGLGQFLVGRALQVALQQNGCDLQRFKAMVNESADLLGERLERQRVAKVLRRSDIVRSLPDPRRSRLK